MTSNESIDEGTIQATDAIDTGSCRTNLKRKHINPSSEITIQESQINFIDMSTSDIGNTLMTDVQGQDDPLDESDNMVHKNDVASSPSLPFLPLRQLRLEAIFHPKFENEQQQTKTKSIDNKSSTTKEVNNKSNDTLKNQSIREKMIERCRCVPSTTEETTIDGPNDSSNEHGGYIEVSIKHSGSLVLWSGRERYYSKNSTNNMFTYTCEILLRQHFYHYAVQIRTNHTSTTIHDSYDDDTPISHIAEQLYDSCSNYVVQNRLTLSFEVITSVLGDHGAHPNKDFIILTAIADRNRIQQLHQQYPLNSKQCNDESIFYSTIEIIEFAQQFHLPHNDYWIYSTEQSIQQLFELYDTCREVGATSTVIPALSRAATLNSSQSNETEHCDYYIESMYPHATYQGEILEGIVIRYVPIQLNFINSQSNTNYRVSILEKIQRLAQNSRKILHQFSSNIDDNCIETLTIDVAASIPDGKGERQQHTTVFSVNLRQLLDETKALYSKKGMDEFERSLFNILQQSNINKSERPTIHRISDSEGWSSSTISSQIPVWIEALLENVGSDVHGHPVDVETQQIAKLIHDLSQVSKNVTYAVFQEQQPQGNTCMNNQNQNSNESILSSRYICIVHVLHDQTFHKYHLLKSDTDLPLFRGFSFQLIGGYDTTSNETSVSGIIKTAKNNAQISECNKDLLATSQSTNKNETLMLKMKFLPYMVRTFGCRNGLKAIRQADGIVAFSNFTNNLMTKWGISDISKQIWRPFFVGWAHYAQPLLRSGGNRHPSPTFDTDDAKSLPPLSEYSYLYHLEYFQQQYKSGKYKVNECRGTFQGLVVIVSPEIEESEKMADFVAERLGGAKRVTGTSDISASTMDHACAPGQGIVCSSTIDNGYTKIRKHLVKDFAAFISIVLVRCDDVAFPLLNQAESKEIMGLLKGWKATKCARNVAIPDRLDSNIDSKSFNPSDSLKEVLLQLESPVVKDTRPGILVFFPTIPGCGKSSIVKEVDKNIPYSILNRRIIIEEGDRVKGKFWPYIKKIRRQSFSDINIADKNAPSSAWDIIGNICTSTNALAVPVIPDTSSLQTTRVVGYRMKDGSEDNTTGHLYPFSLTYLAVCMTRVLSRPAGSHAGNLDQSNKRLCLIVVKFFTFYRNLSAEQFIVSLTTALESTGALVTPSPITVPFFNNTCDTKLPPDAEALLIEALRCQLGYDKSDCDTSNPSSQDEYLDDLELRLRKTLERYRHVIEGMTSDVSHTREIFIKSLVEKIKEVDLIQSYDTPSFIKIVSIDVEVLSVWDILNDLAKRNESLNCFFDRILQGKRVESLLSTLSNAESMDELGEDRTSEDAEELVGIVKKTHVTLGHCSDMSQSDIRSLFTPHLESSVELTTSELLWNDRVMAMAVTVSELTNDGNVLPSSKNEFVHITIWCDKDVNALEANTLPKLHAENKAHSIKFPDRTLSGTVSFWNV